MKLHEYSPLYVIGDGNCMYSTISLGIFDPEEQHLHMATTIEIILHCQSYDVQARDYSGEIHDPCIISEYWVLLSFTCTLGSFSEMTHMYACSAVLGKAFESYYLLCSSVRPSFTRCITGRGVTNEAGTDVTCLMWTQTMQLVDLLSLEFADDDLESVEPAVAVRQPHFDESSVVVP
ncbi:hypothetical protein LSAT2_009767, partial [Lamellibrachia satsuma]